MHGTTEKDCDESRKICRSKEFGLNSIVLEVPSAASLLQ